VNSELGHSVAVAVSQFGTVYVADAGKQSQVNSFQVNHAEFGHVTLGSSGTPQTLNFVVDGTATLTGVAIYTSGTQNLDFTIVANSGTPCTTGSNGISCTVNVQFAPTAAGLRRGALVLSHTDTVLGTSTLSVPLSGIGDAPVAALLPAVGSVLSPGSVAVDQPFETAYDMSQALKNNTVSKIPAGGGSGCTLAPPGIVLAVLGTIMFAYSVLGDRVGLDFNCPNWILAPLCILGLLLLMIGSYLAVEDSQLIYKSAKNSQFSFSHAGLSGRFIGGALITFLRSFRNFRYPGVILMSRWLSSSTVSFGFGSDITPPPGWSGYSMSGASWRPIRVPYGNALRKLVRARCSEMLAHRGI
jgi:hypothetical protein